MRARPHFLPPSGYWFMCCTCTLTRVLIYMFVMVNGFSDLVLLDFVSRCVIAVLLVALVSIVCRTGIVSLCAFVRWVHTIVM